MTNEPNRSTLGNLALALSLAALLTLAAMPCAAAPSDRDRGPDLLTPWSLDLHGAWSVFTGWLDHLWGAHGAYIDPDGQRLSAADSDTDFGTGPSASTRWEPRHGAYIDPDGAK